MSVLVKGMVMPKRCLECNMMIADEQDYCSVTMHDLCFSDYYAYVKPSWCPLVEVPEHGRLIDADKIRYHSGTWEKGFDWVMQSEIALMPTVIPADKDGDNNG